jgi:hypothetical protein
MASGPTACAELATAPEWWRRSADLHKQDIARAAHPTTKPGSRTSSASACTRPVRLAGTIATIETATGRLLAECSTADMPDGVIYEPCGKRRESVRLPRQVRHQIHRGHRAHLGLYADPHGSHTERFVYRGLRTMPPTWPTCCGSGRLPEGWIAPPAVRELPEIVRHRAKLVAWRSGLKASVHGVLAKQGLHPRVPDLFGVAGRQWLSTAALDVAYRLRVNALRRLIDAIDFELTALAGPLRAALAEHAGFHAVQKVPSVGPTLAAIFIAEIGDVTRFAGPAQLSSWAGLTPKHRESDTVIHRGPITKQGSTGGRRCRRTWRYDTLGARGYSRSRRP